MRTSREANVSDVEQWRWVDADGSEHGVVLHELRRLLATGVLPPYVLVWKPGWAAWLQAMHVLDLRGALGPLSGNAHEAPLTADLVQQPPPPPLEQYDAVGHPRDRPLMGVPPPPPSMPAPAEFRQTPTSAPVRRPIAVRNVMPTLTDEGQSARSSTLRPMGAMPPPPRAMPPQGKIPIFDEMDRTSSESGDFRASIPAAPTEATDGTHYEPRAVPPTPIPEKDTTPPIRRRVAQRNVWMAAGALGVVAAGVIWFVSASQKESVTEGTPAAAGSKPATGSAFYCMQQGPAQRLAPNGVVSVPPLFAETPGSPRIAVGFAAAPRRAVGMTLDSLTLAFDVPFQKDTDGDIIGVVPLPGNGKPDFAVDLQEKDLAQVRTVGGARRFTLGFTTDGLVRRDDKGVEVVWRGDWKPDETTVPRVASIPKVGFAVAVRAGDEAPNVFMGLLTPEGKPRTELRRVDRVAFNSGTPSVAVNDHSVLVTFAVQNVVGDHGHGASKKKASSSGAWHIRLASAALDKIPETATDFVLPQGGPGENAISPSAAGLENGRFLLQWTEGAAGTRVVRAVILGSNLAPEGQPITLSPPGANAGQGALWAQGNRAIALFFVQNVGSHELWGASLKCP